MDTPLRQQDRHRIAEALAKSSAAICALIGGIAPNNPLAGALHQLYGSADGAVRASITAYKQDVIDRVRGDLQDILALL
ncbi:MAG: hypothetical protein WAT93_12065 [Pontixanthobacter sp.]